MWCIDLNIHALCLLNTLCVCTLGFALIYVGLYKRAVYEEEAEGGSQNTALLISGVSAVVIKFICL